MNWCYTIKTETTDRKNIMKTQSVEWFIERFENNDITLKAAMTIPFNHQHKNCRKALEQYCIINPNRVEKILQQVKETA